MRRNKRTKIKRYNKIYRSRSSTRRKVFKIAGFVVAIAVVIFVGYSVAGPFMDFINGNIAPSVPSDSSGSSVSISSLSSDSSQTDPAVNTTFVKAVVLPLETTKGSSLTQFLTQAKEDGYNAVVLELKDVNGTLHYRSAVAQAEEYGAVAEDALEIAPVIKTIKDSGLKPIAKLSAFMDKTAPSVARDNGYLYENSSSAWWDNSVDNGGKPWLNPYKTAACDYLVAIQNDLISKGFDTIVWHKVEFPEVRVFSSANMGPEAEGVTQQEALNKFIARCETEAKAKDAAVFISYPVEAAFGINESWFGVNPSELKITNVAPELNLSAFGSSFAIGDVPVDFSNPREAVSQIMSAYITKVTGYERLMLFSPDASLAETIDNVFRALKLEEYVIG